MFKLIPYLREIKKNNNNNNNKTKRKKKDVLILFIEKFTWFEYISLLLFKYWAKT